MFVGNGDFDGWETVEDVEFGQVERRVVVYGVRVFEGDEVQPAAAAGAAGGGADFVADGLELVAGFFVLLCGKWSASNSEQCQSWNAYNGVQC